MSDDTLDRDEDCPVCGSGDCHGHLNPQGGLEPQASPPKAWTDDMGEISGFGGPYEACCRRMFFAGAAWFDAHPLADPRYLGSPQIYGIIMEDNHNAKELTAAITGAAGDHGCTGAMHQAVVGHCLAYRRLGWNAYCQELRTREVKEQTEEKKPDA